MIGLGDEAVVDKPLDDAVQVTGVEDDQTFGTLGDLLHEAVTVALALGKRDEKLEVDRLEREKVARVGGHDGLEVAYSSINYTAASGVSFSGPRGGARTVSVNARRAVTTDDY
jgi:hypothetical protein